MVKLSQAAKILSQVFKKLRSLLTVQHTYDLPFTLKSESGFLKTCDKILVACDIFSIFLMFLANFHFQGSHMRAVLAICKHMATLKIESDLLLLLRKLKNP